MPHSSPSLLQNKILDAFKSKYLFESTYTNCSEWLNAHKMPKWALDSIKELVQQEAWQELNDRFYQPLILGTGGMRGRTIGKIMTQAEKGSTSYIFPQPPAHPAVGSCYLNNITLIKATLALFRYTESYLHSTKAFLKIPTLVIAHDVRFFSKHFCDLIAATWTQLGGKALTFNGPRSTPQLSFSVRYFQATAGVVITASHNPYHDNGYKIYFQDGAQVTSPHAEAITKCFEKIELEHVLPYLTPLTTDWTVIPIEEEKAYLDAVATTLLQPKLLQSYPPKVVFSPLHGTGAVMGIPILKSAGVTVVPVVEQYSMDSTFPTVSAPNPEYPEALSLSIAKAISVQADAVVVTDPDADRMGVAVRNSDNSFTVLTGNQVSCLLAEYRIIQFKQLGLLPPKGSKQATLIKSFVTAPMQINIAEKHGIKLVNTLTGFKWIAEKLENYEVALKNKLFETQGIQLDYCNTKLDTRNKLLLQHSTFFIFGSEESYGYLGNDLIRDKDAHGASLMFCELIAYLKSQNTTVLKHLDNLYLKYGYYFESSFNIVYEGSSGALAISTILNNYRLNPPVTLGKFEVQTFTDFGKQTLVDADGKKIPAQDFYFIQFKNGYQYAVRGSGTEPKIKFYLFGYESVKNIEELEIIKSNSKNLMEILKQAVETDAYKRANS
jgi:phosphoglucomutase